MHFFNRHMAVGVGRLVGRRLFLHQMRILLCARTPYTRGGSCFVLFTPEAGPALYFLHQRRVLLCTSYTRDGSCFVLLTPEAGPALYFLHQRWSCFVLLTPEAGPALYFLHQRRVLLCTSYTRGGSCFVLLTPEAGPALYMLELLFGRDCWALYIKDVIQHF